MCQKAPGDLQGYKGFLLSHWFPRGQVLNKKELSRNTARTRWNNRISGAFIEVGVELIHFWNMPNQIEQAIPYQLSPSQAGEFNLHASIVHLAEAVGRRLSPSQFRSVLPVTGRISARGNAGGSPSAGGGSGGSINLTVGTLAGAGVISADGGAGNALGGGGSGGRIAMVYNTKGFPLDWDPMNVFFWLFAGMLLRLADHPPERSQGS